MGNFFSTFEPSNNNNQRRGGVGFNINRETNNRVVVSENPKLSYYSNVTKHCNSKYGNVSIHVGQLEQREVIIKRIKKYNSTLVQQEIEVLGKLVCHPNILRYFYKVHDDQFLYLVFESYSSSLANYFKNEHIRQNFPIKRIMKDISKGVDYLNKLRILHLNINLENVVVLYESRSNMFTAKLANFEFALELNEQRNVKLIKIPGGIENFQAPEVLYNKTANIASDIYSMGCLFFTLNCSGHIMEQIIYPQQEQRITTKLYMLKQNNSSNTLCAHLITEMLKYDGLKRINTLLILQHPYFFSSQQDLIFILDAHKMIESKNDNFKRLLFINSKVVIGRTGSWRDQVDESVLKLLMILKKAHCSRVGSEISDDQPKGNILNLIQTIRNSVSFFNYSLFNRLL